MIYLYIGFRSTNENNLRMPINEYERPFRAASRHKLNSTVWNAEKHNYVFARMMLCEYIFLRVFRVYFPLASFCRSFCVMCVFFCFSRFLDVYRLVQSMLLLFGMVFFYYYCSYSTQCFITSCSLFRAARV